MSQQPQIDELREEAQARREAIGTDVDMFTDRVLPGRIVDRQKARFSERVSNVRDTVFGTPDHRRSSGEDRSGGVADHLKDAPGAVAHFAEGSPVAAGLVGLGLGLLAATLIPATRTENKIAADIRPQVEAAVTGLARSGQAAVEDVKPAALEAKDAVTESAKDSAHQVQDQARDAAGEVTDNAKTQAADVRHE